ncbi:hypothetical protein QJS10_CPA10g00596 [Acorus calamus]|uniref:Programmed cell death 5 n=1 Tax=Acorus calamus TaxID=4465 RepID=A0AAV9DYW7_ACOCL|nr:hypothetical protein QJS10_CPA10g00596 [Acorus calamus]
MADPELEAIRQRRMQELMGQQGLANQQNSGQQKAQEEAKREADERRQLMLSQILSPEARERRWRMTLYGKWCKIACLRILRTWYQIQRRRSVLEDDD